MSGVKRYHLECFIDNYYTHRQFVLASDYDACASRLHEVAEVCTIAEQERDALRAQVGVMRELLLQVKQFDIEQRTGGAFNLSGLLKRIDAALQAEQ